MTKRVLITGASGFSGRHMCDYLSKLDEPVTIIGTDIIGCQLINCDPFYKLDMSAAQQVANLIKKSKPDCIIHLAGTFGGKDLQQIYKVNVLSVLALLEAARKYAPDVVIIVTGSAAEYGRIEPGQLPVNEETPCNPLTPYGLSKLLATQSVMYYYRVHHICSMIVRPFQLIGKGVTVHLAPGAFSDQLKQATTKGPRVIKVGNLESSRDFLDIHDAVEAMWALCRKPAPGQIFNLCSGQPAKISDLLQMMISHCGVEVKIEVDPGCLRGQAEVPVVYGTFEKLKLHCGWQPKTNLQQSVEDIISS